MTMRRGVSNGAVRRWGNDTIGFWDAFGAGLIWVSLGAGLAVTGVVLLVFLWPVLIPLGIAALVWRVWGDRIEDWRYTRQMRRYPVSPVIDRRDFDPLAARRPKGWKP